MFFLLLLLSVASLGIVYFNTEFDFFLKAASLSAIAWVLFVAVFRILLRSLCSGRGIFAVIPLIFASRAHIRHIVDHQIGLKTGQRLNARAFAGLGIAFAAYYWSLRYVVLMESEGYIGSCNVIYLWGHLALWFQCGGQTVFLAIEMLMLSGFVLAGWMLTLFRFFSLAEIVSDPPRLGRLFAGARWGAGSIGGSIRVLGWSLMLATGVLWGLTCLFFLFSLSVRNLGSFPVGAEIEVTTLFFILIPFSVLMHPYWLMLVYGFGGVLRLFHRQK